MISPWSFSCSMKPSPEIFGGVDSSQFLQLFSTYARFPRAFAVSAPGSCSSSSRWALLGLVETCLLYLPLRPALVEASAGAVHLTGFEPLFGRCFFSIVCLDLYDFVKDLIITQSIPTESCAC